MTRKHSIAAVVFVSIATTAGYIAGGIWRADTDAGTKLPLSLVAGYQFQYACFLWPRTQFCSVATERLLAKASGVPQRYIGANLRAISRGAGNSRDVAVLNAVRRIIRASEWVAASSAAGSLLLLFLFAWAFASRRRSKDRRRLALRTREFALLCQRAPQIHIAGVPIPRKLEPRGILLPGAPGTGKSQVIRGVMALARARGDTVAAIDRGGELLQHFYRKGDVIFCPLDRRGVPWSLLADARTDAQRDQLAALLFPIAGDGSPSDYFQRAAGAVFAAILGSVGDATNGDLWAVLSNKARLAQTLRGTIAEQYTEAREWGSIFTTLANAVAWLRYLPPDAGTDSFSIRSFVAAVDRRPGRAIFCLVPKQSAATLAPLASLFAGLVAHESLSLAPSDSRRLWLFTDELGSFPRLADFSMALTEGRKHGLCTVSAVQAIAQLRKLYGPDGAQELTGCFTTWLILRTGDADTAEHLSKHIGEEEVVERRQSKSVGDGPSGGTKSRGWSDQVRIKRRVLARAIMELPDLQGFLCVGEHKPARVTVPIVRLRAVTQPFLPVTERPITATPPSVRPAAGDALPPLLDPDALSGGAE